jgi:hypothetical protein
MPHVMASYAWGEYQDLVRQVVQVLKSKDVDVWIDTEGSSLLEKMQGSTDTMMIKAVNLSSHVVVFISKKYIKSANCNQEVRLTIANMDDANVLCLRCLLVEDIFVLHSLMFCTA